MGHGTPHIINQAYPAFDYWLKRCGFDNVFVGTVEGYPTLDTLLEQLKERQYQEVVLVPMMLVAGDHAQNDMAPGRKALGQAVPRENQQGDGRQSESQRIDPPCYQNEQHGVQHDEPQRVARGDRTRRNLAAARARVLRVDPPVGPTVESHSRVACQHHGQKHLDQYRPLERQTVGLQRVHVSDQCERKREYRMGKLDERRVARDGCETIHGNGVFYEFAKLTNFAYE